MKKVFHSSYIFAGLLIILLSVMVYYYISYRQNQKISVHAAYLLNSLENDYKTISAFYKKSADMLVDLHIKTPRILSIFNRAASEIKGEKDAAREKLFKVLAPLYESITKYNVRQLHFHLPNCESFLRIHKPEKYGDNLKDIRYSVYMANKKLKSYHGFEEGRVYNGFRNVYPLFLNGKHLGSVEISYQFNEIVESLRQEFNENLTLLIEKDVVTNKVWSDLRDFYRQSSLSEKYMVENYYAPDSLTQSANVKLKNIIAEKLKNNERFHIPLECGNDFLSVLFMPVKNVEGIKVAYIVAYEKDSILQSYIEEYKIQRISLIIITLMLMVISFLIISGRIAREENEDKIARNEKLLQKVTARVPGMIYQFRYYPDGRFSIPYASKWMNDIFEVNPEDVKNSADPVFNKIHEDDIAKVRESILESFDKLSTWKIEFRVMLPKKGLRWLRGESEPEKMDDGSVIWHGYIHDVTERKHVEQVLHENEEKFRKIGNSALDAIIMINEQGKVEYWNPSAERMFLYYRDEILGKKIHDLLMPPQYLGQQQKGWAKFALTGKGAAIGQILELTALRKNGEEFPIEIALNTMKIDNKNWALASIRDITERKKSEADIHEREAQFRTIFDHSPQPMALVENSSGKITEVNEMLCAKIELSKEEIIGKKSVEIGFLTKHEIKRFYILLLRKGLVKNMQTSFLSSSGRETTANMYARFITIKGKKYILTIFDDITEKKIAEEKLESAFQRINSIMKSVQAGVILVRKSDRVIVDANPAVEKMLGLKLVDIIGKPCYTHICPAEVGGCPVIDEGKRLNNSERKIINSRGELIPILKNANIIELEGEEYLLETFVDISKQKEAEEELKKAREMAETANKAKSEFLANMSHEIRTPMNSILGFSEVMLNNTNDEKQKDYLNTILSSGKTLLSIINDILDLSKIEAGKMEISPMPVDLRIVIKEIAQIFQQKVLEKNIDFATIMDDRFPASITIDEVRLRQILLNLTGNAVKFTSSGFVKIILELINDMGELVDFDILVIDSGIGINESDQKTIFESFRQQSGHDVKKFGGTGLGLAISKRLTEMMGGEISVESEPGKGSTFKLAFKNIKYSSEELTQNESFSWGSEEIVFMGSKVLVVDDIGFNRDLVRSFLDKYDLVILDAEDGEKGIKSARENNPDLIFMDIRMPGMNGYEAAKILKRESETSGIPVIALTASTMQSEEVKIKGQFDGYLRKPVHRKNIVDELIKFIPYTRRDKIKDEEKENDNKEVLKENLNNEIKEEFRKLYFDGIDDMIDMMIMDELEEFACNVIKFGEKYESRSIKILGESLKQSISEFNFEKISENINMIKILFSDIKEEKDD